MNLIPILLNFEFILFWIMFLIFQNKLDKTSTNRTAVCVYLGILFYVIGNYFNYTYEALMGAETILPIILYWPYLKHFFHIKSILKITLLLCCASWIFQVFGSNNYEWLYKEAISGNYLTGYVWVNKIHMPVIELLFYPLTILGVLSKFSALSYVLDDKKYELKKSKLRYITYSIMGLLFSFGFVGFIYVLLNGVFLWHLGLGLFAYGIVIVGWFISKRVKTFLNARISFYVAMFSIFEFSCWEFIHSSVFSHWVCNENVGLESYWTFLKNIRFPETSFSNGYIWGPAQYLAYPTVYIATYILILTFENLFKNKVVKKTLLPMK